MTKKKVDTPPVLSENLSLVTTLILQSLRMRDTSSHCDVTEPNESYKNKPNKKLFFFASRGANGDEIERTTDTQASCEAFFYSLLLAVLFVKKRRRARQRKERISRNCVCVVEGMLKDLNGAAGRRRRSLMSDENERESHERKLSDSFIASCSNNNRKIWDTAWTALVVFVCSGEHTEMETDVEYPFQWKIKGNTNQLTNQPTTKTAKLFLSLLDFFSSSSFKPSREWNKEGRRRTHHQERKLLIFENL